MERGNKAASVHPLRSRSGASTSKSSTAVKRDSLVAELEKDPQLSTAKRQQRTQVFTSNLAQANLERQLVSAHATKVELEAKLRERESQIDRLERDRRWLADREKEEKEGREKERHEYQEEKLMLEEDLKTLRKTLSTLREEHADLVDSHQALSHSRAQSESAHRSVLSTFASKETHLETLLKESHKLSEEHLRTISGLQAQIEELNLQRENDAKLSAEEEGMGIIRQELQKQVAYLRDLERTNTNLQGELNVLRTRNVSIEVLREEKRALEVKLGRMEEFREKAARLEAELDAGRREREAWASTGSASGTSVTLVQTLADLRLNHARLLEEHGANVALLRSQEVEIKSLSSRETEACHRAECLESEVGTLRKDLERREGKIKLVEREVGFLKAMMASYTVERSRESGSDDEEHSQDNAHVLHLESILEEYKVTNERLMQELDQASNQQKEFSVAELQIARERVTELEQSLSSAQTQIQTHSETIQTLEAHSKDLETKAKVLEDANENLEQTLHDLGGEIAGGRHVPPGVRVLCMQQNPESDWMEMRKEAVESVKKENEALIRRCRELEERVGDFKRESGSENEEPLGWVDTEGNAAREELVPRASWEQARKEKEHARSEVEKLEKRLSRLKQIFQSKGDEFRDAIAAILGVKLAFFQNGNVRVTSIYDLTTSFVFQPTKAGQQGARMQLVGQGEGGPQDLPNLMEYWLGKEECIPGFMASVTLECYDNDKKYGAAASTT